MINSLEELAACRDTAVDLRGSAQLINTASCSERDQVHVSLCSLLIRLDFMTVVVDAILRWDSEEFKMKGRTFSALQLSGLCHCLMSAAVVEQRWVCQIFYQSS